MSNEVPQDQPNFEIYMKNMVKLPARIDFGSCMMPPNLKVAAKEYRKNKAF